MEHSFIRHGKKAGKVITKRIRKSYTGSWNRYHSRDNLQTTTVNITSNIEQPPGNKIIEAEKWDSNGNSYAKVLMNTSTD